MVCFRACWAAVVDAAGAVVVDSAEAEAAVVVEDLADLEAGGLVAAALAGVGRV